MLYIELPPGIAALQKNAEQFDFFVYEGRSYRLDDIVSSANNRRYTDEANGLSLSVTSNCPSENKCYVEYLPGKGKPSGWCVIMNGVDKKKESDAIASRDGSFLCRFFLNPERKMEIEASRFQVQTERREKGARSV